MQLAEYFQSEGRGSAARLANAIGAFTSDMSDWAKGNRPVPLKYCSLIEKETRGKVTRQELCPTDWHIVWPELAKRKAKQSPVSVSVS